MAIRAKSCLDEQHPFIDRTTHLPLYNLLIEERVHYIKNAIEHNVTRLVCERLLQT